MKLSKMTDTQLSAERQKLKEPCLKTKVSHGKINFACGCVEDCEGQPDAATLIWLGDVHSDDCGKMQTLAHAYHSRYTAIENETDRRRR